MGTFYFVPPPVTAAQLTPPVDLQSTGTSPVFGAGTTGDTNNRIEMDADGGLRFGTGATAVDTTFNRTAANTLHVAGTMQASGNFDVTSAGSGLKVAEGSGTNAKQGTFALSGAATTVVSNSTVTASSRILLQVQALGTVAVASTLAVTARSAGVSFTVTPSVAADTSTVAFEIFEPG
jgi:hypothetical protein